MLRVLCGLLVTAVLVMPAAAQQNGGAAAEFNQKFEQWVTLLNRLRELQAQYKVANPEDRSPLEQEFNQKLKQAEELYPQLESQAQVAFKAAPDNKQLADFRLFDVLAQIGHLELDAHSRLPQFKVYRSTMTCGLS